MTDGGAAVKANAAGIKQQRVLTTAIIAIGLAFSYSQARADESVQVSASAPAVTESANPAPVIVKGAVAGGLQPGDAMRLTKRGVQRVKAAQHASRQSHDDCDR